MDLISQPVFNNHITNLPHLIRLSLVPVLLQIDPVFNACPTENGMAPSHTAFKPKPIKQAAKITERNVRISGSSQHVKKNLFPSAHCLKLVLSPGLEQ
jgi:hypothetical protein